MHPQDLRERQESVQLVDVREPREWHAGRIPGASWVPMGELEARVHELDAERPVVTVCRSGQRSGEMAEFLTGRGYRAENLEGGVQAWVDAGFPLRTPDGEQPGEVV